MHLTSDSDYLNRVIIEAVANSNGIRFSILQQRLQSNFGITASKATIYRRISDLVERNIILRQGGKLLPNLVWITSIRQLADKLAANNIGLDSGLLDLPTVEGKSITYRASSVAKLDPLWNHVFLELSYRFNEREWFGYNQHAWHLISIPDSERQFWSTVVEDGQQCHLLYGSDSILDLHAVQNLQIDGFETNTCSKSEFHHQLQSFWASEKYVFEVTFAKSITKNFDAVFDSVTDLEHFDEEFFAAIFRERGDCTLKIEKNSEKAALYRSYLTPFFHSYKKVVNE